MSGAVPTAAARASSHPMVTEYSQQQLSEISKALGRGDWHKASELMDMLGIHLDLMRVHWMASKAERE